MSLYDYKKSLEISAEDPPFYALIMAAAQQADTSNLTLFEQVFPGTIEEVRARYNAPGGVIYEGEN